MKNAIIFHGSGGNPKSFWHPWLKRELEKKGYNVLLPQLPNPDVGDIKEWLPFALKNRNYNKETVLIGHSSGGPLILSILENINVKIKQAILVAAYSTTYDEKEKPLILQKSYNWKKIKNNVEDIIFINSDNDPWGCDDKKGRIMFDNLGGKQIILHGEGHMGSLKFKQPYKKFPFLLKLIEG